MAWEDNQLVILDGMPREGYDYIIDAVWKEMYYCGIWSNIMILK